MPTIRRDLYDKLVALPKAQAITKEQMIANVTAAATTTDSPPPLPFSGLPRSWDDIDVGKMVLVHESAEDGWWECLVLSRENDVLTLRFRDYPKLPTFVRHVSNVALVNPGPA